jgi:multiple sugar transport system substrate-binding protein
VGCRKSTWADAEVNRVIPFYHRLEALHENARELPRMETWPLIASLIDDVTTRAISGDVPTAQLLEEAQGKAKSIVQRS